MSEHESRRRPEIGPARVPAVLSGGLRATTCCCTSLWHIPAVVGTLAVSTAKIATSKRYALANQLPKRKPKAFRIAVRSGG
jgi:hypothetical protein